MAEDNKKVNETEEQNTTTEPTVVNNVSSTEPKVNFFQKNKAILIVAGIAVVGLVLFILILKLIFSSLFGSKTVENPLVYLTSDGELKYITSNKKESTVMEKDFTDSADVVYSKTSNRYILYTKSNNLYLIDTKKSKDAEKITSDVDDFTFSENDKYIVFTDDDDTLYSYNYKDKSKLDSDISSIVKVTKDRVFYKKDGNLYSRSLNASKDDKVKIAADYSYAYFNEDMTKILYSKYDDGAYDYYVYTIKSQKETKVISEATTVYSYSKDFTKFIYAAKNDGASFDLNKIVEDDMKEKDSEFVDLRESYIAGEIDYSTYYANYKEKNNIDDRNEIREKLKEKYTLSSTYEIYYVNGNKQEKIAEDASSILYADADTKRVVYSKTSYDTSEKIKLSDVSYFSKITSFLKTNSVNRVIYKLGTKDEVELISEAKSTPKIYVINNDLYYNYDGELSYVKINGAKLGKATSVAEDVSVIDSTGDYKDSMVILTDVSSYKGDLKTVKNGKVTKVATDVYSKGITITESKKIYFYTDFDDNAGDFNVYTGKVKTLFTDIGYVHYIKDNYMYVFKDYSSSADTYDLYRYKGSKLTLIDYGVESVY